MTEEEFELKLKERISSVLETEHEKFTIESWNNFEKKLVHSQNKRRLIFIVKIAATFLIFIVGGIPLLFLDNKYTNDTTEATLHNNIKHGKAAISVEDDEINNDKLITGSKLKSDGKNNYRIELTSGSNTQRGLISKPVDTRSYNNNISLTHDDILAKNEVGTLPSESTVQTIDTLQNPSPINTIVKQNLPSNSQELVQPSQPTNNLLRFGANVSSIVNYDQVNHNSQLNIGGGIFVEIPLLGNLVLHSGLLLTNQTINFQYVTEHTLVLGKHVKSKDLKLTGFDIPINLKYRFGITGTRMFLAAGVSSLTFVKENIETKYDVNSTVATLSGGGLTIMQTVSKEEVETNSLGSFNDFFFAKVLNLSFGVELPLNTRNVLLIEPYLKYSAGPLKSVKAYPSMLGINLGIIF